MMIEARQALANEAPWMGIVFEIMAHIGCRFAESSIPNERIDFEKIILWVEDSKRRPDDPKKLFEDDRALGKRFRFPTGGGGGSGTFSIACRADYRRNG
jgi:hypothetical protein